MTGGDFEYADDASDLLKLLQHPDHAHHMAGLDDPLGGLRGIAADALDEQGRSEEAQLLRTPGAHVEIRPDGTVKPSFMERQTHPAYGPNAHSWEQFVKPSADGPRDESNDDGTTSHGATYWFATYGKPRRTAWVPNPAGGVSSRMVSDEDQPEQWWWNPADGEALHPIDLQRIHPRYHEYPSTSDLEESHPLTPSEVAWMRHHATTDEFK